jgi:uncharacterized membrane protein
MKSYTWFGWSTALAVALCVIGVAVLPPFVGAGVREVIMDAFAGVCHQLPERSPHMHGTPVALCDRCLGIYGGVALGVLAFPAIPRQADRIHRYAGLVLVVALVPLGIDWIGPIINGWGNEAWSRAGTGVLFGGVAGVLVGRASATFRRNASPAAVQRDGHDAEKK